jgi:dihydropteroate synthase
VSAPRLMGVVNATPDSFSDVGGEDPVDRARALIDAGAELIDVGGESGITGVPAVEAGAEITRVVPVVERIAALGVEVSVDTYKPEVARAAIDAGARMVNDVSGLRDPGLADVCAETGAALVVMHTYAPPKEKVLDRRHDATVVDDVLAFLADRMALAESRGVARERIVLDPGPDFGKTPWQTVEVLRALPQVVALGRPVLLAVSRKDFVGVITGRRPRERDPGTLGAIAAGVDAGASILRVHDVRGVADFLAVRDVLAGRRELPPDAALPVALRRERAS